MPKSKISPEKATKNMTLQMIGFTRSSSQEVADGYGPSIQKSELLADAKSNGYLVDSIRDCRKRTPFFRNRDSGGL